jgi:hypothetical protein
MRIHTARQLAYCNLLPSGLLIFSFHTSHIEKLVTVCQLYAVLFLVCYSLVSMISDARVAGVVLFEAVAETCREIQQ